MRINVWLMYEVVVVCRGRLIIVNDWLMNHSSEQFKMKLCLERRNFPEMHHWVSTKFEIFHIFIVQFNGSKTTNRRKMILVMEVNIFGVD